LFDISKSITAGSGVVPADQVLAKSGELASYNAVGLPEGIPELARAPVEAFQDPNAYTNIAQKPVYMGPATTAEQYSGNLFKGPTAVGQKVLAANLSPSEKWDALVKGASKIPTNSWEENKKLIKPGLAAAAPLLAYGMNGSGNNKPLGPTSNTQGAIPQYRFNQTRNPNWNPMDSTQPYYLPQTYTPMAHGGLAGLAGGGQATQPRMIKGPGTGLSDDIPAVIQGGQKAALADGEFVVSSDVVSALGGGSTDAGARKLYAMMDRIRKQAHGTKKQVKKVPDRAMAA
jgi:hypothetical protein